MPEAHFWRDCHVTLTRPKFNVLAVTWMKSGPNPITGVDRCPQSEWSKTWQTDGQTAQLKTSYHHPLPGDNYVWLTDVLTATFTIIFERQELLAVKCMIPMISIDFYYQLAKDLKQSSISRHTFHNMWKRSWFANYSKRFTGFEKTRVFWKNPLVRGFFGLYRFFFSKMTNFSPIKNHVVVTLQILYKI